jgi:hypothetical protein
VSDRDVPYQIATPTTAMTTMTAVSGDTFWLATNLGLPQFGHVGVVVEISCEQSGQGTRAMLRDYGTCNGGGSSRPSRVGEKDPAISNYTLVPTRSKSRRSSRWSPPSDLFILLVRPRRR